MLGGIAGHAGIFASNSDLLKFGNSWLNNKIVSKELKTEVFQNYSSTGKNGKGLGWWCGDYFDEKIPTNLFYHRGFTGCLLCINLEQNICYVVNTNRTYYGRNNKKHRDIYRLVLEDELLEN